MRFWHIFWHELSYWLKERSTYVQFILVPLIMIFVLGSSLAGSEVFKQEDVILPIATVGLVGEGNESMAQAFAQFSQHEEVSRYITIEQISTSAALAEQLRLQQVDYGIVIPKQEEASIQLLQGTNHVINLMMTSIVNEFASASAMHALKLEADHTVVDTSGEEQGTSLQDSEPLVSMGLISSESVTAMQYYAVSILIMFLLYAGLRFGSALLVEERNYTLKRMQSTPARPREIIYAMMLAHFILSLLQAGCMIVISAVVYGVNWHLHLGTVVIACGFVTLCSLCIGLIGAAWFRQSKTLHTFMQTIIIAMVAASGGYVLIPEFQQAAGVYTLPYWGMQIFYNQMLNVAPAATQHGLGILALWAIILGGLSLYFSKKVVTR